MHMLQFSNDVHDLHDVRQGLHVLLMLSINYPYRHTVTHVPSGERYLPPIHEVHRFGLSVHDWHDGWQTGHADVVVLYCDAVQLAEWQYPSGDRASGDRHWRHLPLSWHRMQLMSHLVHWMESDR